MKHVAYCRAAACGRYGPIQGHGYCARCFMWWRRHGAERPASANLRGQLRRCRAAGCPRRERLSRDYCKAHYMRWWRRFGPAQQKLTQEAVA